MGDRTIGETSLRICRALAAGDVLYLADDEQEAEALADAVQALMPGNAIVFVPSSDTLPGDRSPASPANTGARVAALRTLRRLNGEPKRPSLACIMTGEAAARLYAEPAAFDAVPPTLRAGDAIDAEQFAAETQALGYILDDRVDEPGEVALRGEVIDIYPADAGQPARIEIADGRIVQIRHYDSVTQLSTQTCEALEIGRALEPETDRKVSILDHLRPSGLLASTKSDDRRRRFLRLAQQAAGERNIPLDAVEDDAWTKGLKAWPQAELDEAIAALPRFAEQRAPLAAMVAHVKPLLSANRTLLLVGSERDVRFLRPRIEKKLKVKLAPVSDLAQATALPGGSGATLVAPVDRGAVSSQVVMIAAGDLLGSRALVGDAAEPTATILERTLADVRAGDLIIHEDHGLGRVIGMEPAPGDEHAEVIALEYASNARRLVPVAEADRIWRYGADGDALTLDRLDGSTWNKRRATIDQAVAETARALLALTEERAKLEAPIMEPEPSAYEQFVAGFVFNETADQIRAIQAVRDDLVSGRPMDRLVIGDVGFGKTEVALRAAALAALAGYQVVVAAPTTVLVRQHLQTFERRFAGTDIKVGALSRLSSAAEKKAVKAGLADGSIHIVIGTGAVMAKDVRHARLGLVVIDEEQRFGSADKTRLRSRADVHLLALSATPIPRTLHRAMIGLQQISIIATPPARRRPIRTSLTQPDDSHIRTALSREHARGGQSFVVVPRIEDIAPLCERLARIVPDLAIVQAHGKMAAAEIDAAMVRFADGDGDVLLATNIIEAGLDVPRANTMIVWNADRFGLAQLHQLRGRVGRSNRRGQVMLLTEGKDIAPRTMKRLRTLTAYDHLGAGFAISAADLDQRGSGDMLSDAQAGHMKLIGVDLYQHLFEGAPKHARGDDAGLWTPQINIGNSGALPLDWIPDGDLRLGLYLRLSRIFDQEALESFEDELADRFGPLPALARDLMTNARIAGLARELRIDRIDAGPAAIAITLRKDCPIDPATAGLVEKDGRWLFKERTAPQERTLRVLDLLEALMAPNGAPLSPSQPEVTHRVCAPAL